VGDKAPFLDSAGIFNFSFNDLRVSEKASSIFHRFDYRKFIQGKSGELLKAGLSTLSKYKYKFDITRSILGVRNGSVNIT